MALLERISACFLCVRGDELELGIDVYAIANTFCPI
jgi:hypothetical protein